MKAQDAFWRTPDGLSCHAALYAPKSLSSSTPVICIPGLTRNGADFHDLAVALAGRGRTVYALTLRGRGKSDRDPNYLNYHPKQYRDDVLAALDAWDLDRAIFIGTSLGGIVTMLTAETALNRIEKAVINDVGPRLAPEGLARIGALLADRPVTETNSGAAGVAFDDALAAVKRHNVAAFPNADEAFWRAFTERTHKQLDDGLWAPDYDPKIAKALVELGPGDDLWPGLRALTNTPTLLIRGAISDLLTDEIVVEMRDALPNLKDVAVSNVGHAPMLTEPAALSAITTLLND